MYAMQFSFIYLLMTKKNIYNKPTKLNSLQNVDVDFKSKIKIYIFICFSFQKSVL